MRFHDYPKQIEEDLIGRLREMDRRRAARVAALRTPEAVRRYQRRVQRALKTAFGRWPRRSALRPRIWRQSTAENCRIDHLTFESRPGFLVTANLYLPAAIDGPLPGVLFPCGHSATGKAHPLYVEACCRLVREGYAVLIYDPVNQGERDLYSPLDTGGRLTRDNPCSGHNVIGRQLHAAGDWLGAWRLWDGIRAVDYLAKRPEVDSERLVVTGQSGGGTLSAFLWAMEPRLRAVASSCWCTSYLNDLENGMPADEEQYPPGFLAAGFDKIDFFTVRAGEPILLLGQEQDFFDDRGLRRGYAELARLHEMLVGERSTCGLAIDTGTHAFSPANQLAMLSFFNRLFGKPAPSREPVTAPDEAALLVTPQGDVHQAGSRPMVELVAAQAGKAASARPAPASGTLPGIIRQALGVPESEAIPYHRRLFQTVTARPATGQSVCRFVVETELGTACVLRHVGQGITPFRLAPAACVTLYLADLDCQRELEVADGLPGEDPARDLWTLDPRGLGEGLYRPDDPYTLYGHDYMAAGYAVMLNETLLGNRLRDVLAAVRLLRFEGARDIRLTGRRQGAILALLAGVLDPDIDGVISIEAPDSFLALATAPYTFWPAANFPREILKAFDLPDARAALGPRLIEDTRVAPTEYVS